jgi:hypothetical protein
VRWQCLGLGLTLLWAGCQPDAPADDSELRARFGILYGGQIQERRELPLELDRSRQVQVFRLEADPAPASPREVTWEIGMAGAGPLRTDSRGHRAQRRRTRLGAALWRAGETRFEQTLAFAPGDPTGLWSIRVRVGQRVVLDQPFVVYDRRTRSARVRRAAELDGGF